VSQAILVAGYFTQPNTNDEPVLQKDDDWAAIKAHVRDLYFVNSPDDPYGMRRRVFASITIREAPAAAAGLAFVQPAGIAPSL
jgi:hypothetical protein